MRFEGKTAVVTGAGRGIGRAVALALAAEGAELAICARHDATITPVAEEIAKNGGAAVPFVYDVSDKDQVNEFVRKVYEHYDRVDIVVNNAGITRDNFFLRMTAEDWDPVMAVNLRGTFLCTRYFARKMVRQKWGRIINMASVAGEAGNVGQANYAASKAGVIAMTKSAARELARYGITVNAVSPGLIDTDMIADMEDEVRERMKETIPVGRIGSVDDIAAAVLFLASGEASYITGQTMRVDGGLYI